MANSPNLNLPLLAAAQSQKHKTVNEALLALDGLSQITVLNRNLTAPPGSPTNGDAHIVASAPTGDWSGQADAVAYYYDGAWTFFTPVEGWFATDQGTSEALAYDGTDWVLATIYLQAAKQANAAGVIATDMGTSAAGATMSFVQKEEIVTLTGAAIVSSTLTFPDRSIPVFASVHNRTAITGPAGMQWYCYEFGNVAMTFESGYAGNTADAQQQSGPANPMKPIFSDATVDFEDNSVDAGTGTGAAFTGGTVRLTIGYFQAIAASS